MEYIVRWWDRVFIACLGAALPRRWDRPGLCPKHSPRGLPTWAEERRMPAKRHVQFRNHHKIILINGKQFRAGLANNEEPEGTDGRGKIRGIAYVWL